MKIIVLPLLLLAVFSKAFFGAEPTSGSGAEKKVNYYFNDETVTLLKMLREGKIKETDTKKDLVIVGVDQWFIKTMTKHGYGLRVQEHIEKWKSFEDGDYIIFVGTVSAVPEEGFGFVWVVRQRGGGQKGGVMTSVYLKIGNRVVEGSEYPKGIIPFKKKWGIW